MMMHLSATHEHQIVVMVEIKPSSVVLYDETITISKFNRNLLLFSADIPVIEVVAAVLLVLAFPLAEGARLVLHEDALLELGVVVAAAVASVHRDQHRVQFLA